MEDENSDDSRTNVDCEMEVVLLETYSSTAAASNALYLNTSLPSQPQSPTVSIATGMSRGDVLKNRLTKSASKADKSLTIQMKIENARKRQEEKVT
jgi:hypothetical protein